MTWIDDVRGTDSMRAAARRAGVPSATLSRQVNDDLLSFEMVRAISRAYGRSVVADLVRTGHLTEADAGADGIERYLRIATDEQLVLEVASRLDAPGVGQIFDKPASDAVRDAMNVHELRPRNVSAPGEDLPEVAAESLNPLEGTDSDFDNA